MSEEDDWFERALRDLDEESDSSGSGGDPDDSDRAGVADDADGDAEAHEGEPAVDDGASPADDGDSSGDDIDPFGGLRNESTDSPADRAESDTAEDGEDDPADGGPDESADGDAFGGGTFGREGASGEDDPFGGGSSGADDPFGGGASGGGGTFGNDDPFADELSGQPDPEASEVESIDDDGSADPFGGYRNASPAGGFGFDESDGGGAAGDPTGFDVDPEAFESAIERTDIGIEGLDEMILGGVPQRSLLSVIGGAGTGKTTFALQFLNEALESDRNGVYITLEQTRESILSTAEEKGWSFRDHADADRLAVVAIDPVEMANSLASIRNDLTRLIAEFDADRLVLDSVSLLEMMYDHPAKRRSEVFGFTRSLKNAGVTTLLTSEASETNAYASRHGIVEYLTDAVFVLQYVRGSDFRETRLAVEIQKIRDANHSREMKPYDITGNGISVYDQANIF